MARAKKPRIYEIPLDKIERPKAIIRMDIDPDYIKELAQSISEMGLLQPILLSADGDNYEIVAGDCRYLAHKELGLSTITALVKQMKPEEIGLARATENIARTDLTPIEEAATYKNLIDEYGFTLEKVSQKMGKAPATIKRRMDLIRMPPALQKAIHKKQISMTVAEELWSIRDQTQLEYYLMFAIENGATREVARQWANDWKDSVRRSQSPGGDGLQLPLSPLEPRPVYLPCDICIQPVELGVDKLIRVCPECWSMLKKAVEVQK